MKRYSAGIIMAGFLFRALCLHAQDNSQIKALWIVRDAMKSKASVDRAVGAIGQAGLTDVFVQVRGRGDAFYESDFVPRAGGIEESFDPLAYFLEAVRPLPVRVHLWLNVFLIWSADEKPSSGKHIYNVYPEWSVVSADNNTMAEMGTKRARQMKHEGVFYSPSVEDFQDHFVRVVRELVMKYDFAGIHLDYIRYPGDEYDYSLAARSRFMLRFHTDPFAFRRIGHDTLNEKQREWVQSAWERFRREEVTRFVRAVRDSIRSIRPGIALTAAVFADLNVARNRVFQDWPQWLRDRIIDQAVVMNYATDDGTYRERLVVMQAELGSDMFYSKIIHGISLYNQSEYGVKNKIKVCGEFKVRKWSFFSYESVRTKKTYLTLIQSLK